MSTTHLVNAAAGRDRVPAVPSEGGHAVAGPVESLLRVTMYCTGSVWRNHPVEGALSLR